MWTDLRAVALQGNDKEIATTVKKC
jgi:hypothetical protein